MQQPSSLGAPGTRTMMSCWPWGTRLAWFPRQYSFWPPLSLTASIRPHPSITKSAATRQQSHVTWRSLSLTARYRRSVRCVAFLHAATQPFRFQTVSWSLNIKLFCCISSRLDLDSCMYCILDTLHRLTLHLTSKDHLLDQTNYNAN